MPTQPDETSLKQIDALVTLVAQQKFLIERFVAWVDCEDCCSHDPEHNCPKFEVTGKCHLLEDHDVCSDGEDQGGYRTPVAPTMLG